MLGGYKAHSEALEEFKKLHRETKTGTRDTIRTAAVNVLSREESDNASETKTYKRLDNGNYSIRRRTSDIPSESERMPGVDRARRPGKGGRRGLVGRGGLAKCQRVWKMVPQNRDNRPTWLRQYEVQ